MIPVETACLSFLVGFKENKKGMFTVVLVILTNERSLIPFILISSFSAPQATFAADFSQPPAQASPVQPAFDAFGSTASAPRVQPQAPGQFGQFDFFANNGDSNPPPPANAG